LVQVDELEVPGDQVAAMATGEAFAREAFWDEMRKPPFELDVAYRPLAERYELGDDEAEFALRLLGDSEEKAARTLGVPQEEVAFAAMALWGTSLGGQRDKELAARDTTGSDAAVRGHITRGLLKQLAERIEQARPG